MKKQALVGIDVSAQSLDVALERGQLEAADTRRRRAARFPAPPSERLSSGADRA
jgi:hypothetical protein